MRKSKKEKMFKIEKLLIKLCAILVVLFPVLCVISKATLSDMNLGVEIIKREIKEQENKVESLNMKVDELKSLANLQTIIKNEGLSYNSSKVKVILSN